MYNEIKCIMESNVSLIQVELNQIILKAYIAIFVIFFQARLCLVDGEKKY